MEGTCHCGATRWSFDGVPESATVCNCSVCRRYGVLWAYDYDNERIRISGPTRAYSWGGRTIEFRFCAACGCVVCWRRIAPDAAGRHRIAVNLRLAEPEAASRIVLQRFDGLGSFEDLPRDGRCVADVSF